MWIGRGLWRAHGVIGPVIGPVFGSAGAVVDGRRSLLARWISVVW
nr:hypothetical protein [Kibdelosporangium sp. MJ126-NF4]CTQ94796.1 hypothetical protein [Kibdelosporangium sp. MJ126-NF4]